MTNKYLGGDTSLACSEATAGKVDEMVVQVVKKQYARASRLISDNMPKLHELAKYLYEKETITGDEFMEILDRRPEELTATKYTAPEIPEGDIPEGPETAEKAE